MTQDSFTILEQISQSPTTTVYKAHQNALDRTVLLKVLHKHLLRDKGLVARFSREAKACAILRSENIVQVYDLTEVDGAPAIVMEYVEGKSLEDLLLDKSVYSEELLTKVAVSVLKALSYAHDSGVVHRDIKPGNILVAENGTIKVTDFGLASVSDTPSLTMEGSLIGTPAYMSPEQARGETVDSRTDFFSLGVTLIEVLTGQKILVGRSYAECISKIQDFELSSLDGFASKCSPHVFEFLKGLLAPSKFDRFNSANEALGFLTSSSIGEEVQKESLEPETKSKRSVFAIGGVGMVLILVVVLFFALRHSITENVGNQSSNPIPNSSHQIPIEKKVNTQSGGFTAKQPEIEMDKKKQSIPETKTSTLTPRQVASPQGQPLNTATVVDANDSGYVSIVCTPWAKIYIDNEYAGTTPIAGSIKVPKGAHTIMFSNPNFAPIVKQVRVQPQLLSTVEANFLMISGYIFISVEPWAEIYVDDQYRDTTPLSKPIIVSAGTRRLRIHNPAYKDIVRNLTVSAGDTLRLNFSFLTDSQK